MRYLLIILSAIAVSMLTASFAYGDSIPKLWSKYYSLSRKDLPKQKLSVLEELIKETRHSGTRDQFYRAVCLYHDDRIALDWKQTEAADNLLEEQIRDYGNAYLTYLWMRDYSGASIKERLRFIMDNKAALSAEKDINKQDGVNYSDNAFYTLRQLTTDGYDRSLVDILRESSEAMCLLKEYWTGRYPHEGYLEYCEAMMKSGKERYEALKVVSRKYDGKAVGLYPEAGFMSMDFDSLRYSGSVTSAEIREFYGKCLQFEKKRKSFKGPEKRIASDATGVKRLIGILEEKTVGISVYDYEGVTIEGRNIKSAKLSLYKYVTRPDNSKKKVLLRKWNVALPDSGLYQTRSARIVLPELHDGEYGVEAKAGRETASRPLEKYSISAAVRKDKDGFKVYAADCLTGEPYETVKVSAYKRSWGEPETLLAEETVAISGFSKLGENMQKVLAGNNNLFLLFSYVGKDGIERMSRTCYYRNEDKGGYWSPDGHITGQFFTDKPLYKPGDTVSFKGVFYKEMETARVLPDSDITVIFRDSENKEIGSKIIRTNEFGSVSGCFAIPEGLRNGRFSLTAEFEGGRGPVSCSFEVADYKLPSFEIRFDDNYKRYLPGDKATITGRIISYSGHSLSGADIRAEVSEMGHTLIPEMEIGDDGVFSISFTVTNGYVNPEISVRVSDMTGETVEAKYLLIVSPWLNYSIEPVNALSGKLDDGAVVRGDCVIVRFVCEGYLDVPVSYSLCDEDGNILCKGEALSGREEKIDLGPYDCNYFIVRYDRNSFRIVRLKDDGVLDAPVTGLFLDGESDVPSGGEICMTLGSGSGPVWAVATLYGYGREVLDMRLVHFAGERGKTGSLYDLKFRYLDSYPDEVILHIYYFRDGKDHMYTYNYERLEEDKTLPLEFSRFVDKSLPGSDCSVSLKTSPDVEAAVTVYEKSAEQLGSHVWSPVLLRKSHPGSSVIYSSVGTCLVRSLDDPFRHRYGPSDGFDGLYDFGDSEMEMVVVGYGTTTRSLGGAVRGLATKAKNALNDLVAPEAEVYDEMVAFSRAPEKEVEIRSDFSDALCFLPMMYPDAEGNINFSFRTSDKLSRFVVSAFAHDKNMRNRLVRRDMTVSIPVKVSVYEPGFLYVGDQYNVSVGVSADSSSAASGDLYLYVYPGKDYRNLEPVAVHKSHLEIEKGGNSSATFPVIASAAGEIGLKAEFVGNGYSDGMFVSVPVLEPVQTLTEGHSKVILSDMDMAAAEKELREMFTNVPGSEAVAEEISIRDMLLKAIPEEVEPKGKDVISLTAAYFIRLVAAKLNPDLSFDNADLLGKIMDCRNSDGGFAWFPGMESSEAITGRVIDRFARLREWYGSEIPDMTESVKFMDMAHFNGDRPFWRGRLGDASYMLIRSMWPEVPFVKPSSKEDRVRLSVFREFAKHYLSPAAISDYGSRGDIFQKVVRLEILDNLSASDAGEDLAKAWGAGLFASYKLSRSVKGETRSVLEYAVDHRDGGKYYPNAVMPFRGQLEDEAYMHFLISRLISRVAPESDIPNGIRLWLMLQKETQHWESSPSYVEVLSAVLGGSEALLDTRVLALKAEYTKPFEEVKAVGNGYTVERKFMLSGADGKTVELKGGETLSVGDKVIAEYRIWSAENRSFVRLVAPREAALSPVRQISGIYRGGYRDIRTDRTEYYFESYPEEKTVIEEDFFVTSSGVFVAPVVTIESLYAPHYRANGAFSGRLVAE